MENFHHLPISACFQMPSRAPDLWTTQGRRTRDDDVKRESGSPKVQEWRSELVHDGYGQAVTVSPNFRKRLY
jgi:hypothetical protein